MLAVLVLVLPGSAGAASQACDNPTGDQYCPKVEVLTVGGSGSDPGDPGSAAGGLPFTGLDLALSLATAAGLLGAGLALRRIGHSRSAE